MCCSGRRAGEVASAHSQSAILTERGKTGITDMQVTSGTEGTEMTGMRVEFETKLLRFDS